MKYEKKMEGGLSGEGWWGEDVYEHAGHGWSMMAWPGKEAFSAVLDLTHSAAWRWYEQLQYQLTVLTVSI